MPPLLKVCGITRAEDALACVERRVEFIGLIFVPSSARFISVDSAAAIVREVRRNRDSGTQVVGVFADQPVELVNSVAERCELDAVQLHGVETPEEIATIRRPVMKAFSVVSASPIHCERYAAAKWFLFDAPKQLDGGAGQPFDWRHLPASPARPFFVAGGIDPTNVRSLIERVSPDGVDVSRGVEREPGIKDLRRLDALLEAMR